jgi:nicotinamidase-related amidase
MTAFVSRRATCLFKAYAALTSCTVTSAISRSRSPAVEPHSQDVLILKRHWGAFYGTDLDLQLRRRRIETIVLGGIATNFGVESTARNGYEHGYHVVFAEDAMGAFTKASHDFAIQNIFPRLGRVRTTEEILQALGTGK